MKNNRHKNVVGMDFMWLSLTAFLGLFMDMLLAYGLGPLIWRVPIQKWSTGNYVIHWIFICILWGGFAVWILRRSKIVCGFDPFAPAKRPAIWQWAAAAVCLIICLVSTWIDCSGSKLLIDFRRLGVIKFTFQYIYYFFEVMLVTLIIVYGQKAFEVWSGRPNIPYGAIVAALTWGLAHWGTQSSLYTGLLAAACGFCFGVVYLLLNRNLKLTYAALCMMFIL